MRSSCTYVTLTGKLWQSTTTCASGQNAKQSHLRLYHLHPLPRRLRLYPRTFQPRLLCHRHLHSRHLSHHSQHLLGLMERSAFLVVPVARESSLTAALDKALVAAQTAPSSLAQKVPTALASVTTMSKTTHAPTVALQSCNAPAGNTCVIAGQGRKRAIAYLAISPIARWTSTSVGSVAA